MHCINLYHTYICIEILCAFSFHDSLSVSFIVARQKIKMLAYSFFSVELNNTVDYMATYLKEIKTNAIVKNFRSLVSISI